MLRYSPIHPPRSVLIIPKASLLHIFERVGIWHTNMFQEATQSTMFPGVGSLRLLQQDVEEDNNESADIVAAVISNIFLFFLIFGMSATVDVKNLKHQLTNRFAIGCGVSMQFFIMPFLGFLSIMAFQNNGMTRPMAITLLVVTSSPGGSYSNVSSPQCTDVLCRLCLCKLCPIYSHALF